MSQDLSPKIQSVVQKMIADYNRSRKLPRMQVTRGIRNAIIALANNFEANNLTEADVPAFVERHAKDGKVNRKNLTSLIRFLRALQTELELAMIGKNNLCHSAGIRYCAFVQNP